MSTKRVQSDASHDLGATERAKEPLRLESLGEAGDYSPDELRALIQAELITGQPANAENDRLGRIRRTALLLLVGGAIFLIAVTAAWHFLR